MKLSGIFAVLLSASIPSPVFAQNILAAQAGASAKSSVSGAAGTISVVPSALGALIPSSLLAPSIVPGLTPVLAAPSLAQPFALSAAIQPAAASAPWGQGSGDGPLNPLTGLPGQPAKSAISAPVPGSPGIQAELDAVAQKTGQVNSTLAASSGDFEQNATLGSAVFEASLSQGGLAPDGVPVRTTNNIRTLLDQVPDKRVLKLRLQHSGGQTVRALPFNGRAIMGGLTDKRSIMAGSPGLFRKEVRMIIVEEPETIGHVVTVMTDIANISMEGMGHEYGLMLYVNEDGAPLIVVQRGGWFITQVRPQPVIRLPNGRRYLLIGLLAHTHPFGAPIPSAGDHAAVGHYGIFRQRFSLLIVPGGAHSLFDSRNVYPLPVEMHDQPITALFGSF